MNMLLSLLLACGTEVGIIGYTEKPQDNDTSVSIVDSSETAEETSEPSYEPASEPSNEMTDLTIGFAETSLMQIACPPCMGVSSEFDTSMSLKLHQPTSQTYLEGYTPVGTCVTQQLGTYVSSNPISIGGNATFNQQSLYPVGQAEWATTGIPEYQFPRSQPISITTQAGTITNAMNALQGFDDVQPWELRYVDPSYAFAAVVSKTGATFSWQPVLQNAQFEVLLAIYSPDGSQLSGIVSCMENDQGWITVPGQYLQQYQSWSLVAIYLTRHRSERVPAPDFNGWLESHQMWTVLGTGHIE